MVSRKVDVDLNTLSKIFGALDEHASLIERSFNVSLKLTGDEFVISGEQSDVEMAETLIEKLKKSSAKNKIEIIQYIDLIKSGNADEIETLSSDVVAITAKGKRILCRTRGQLDYVRAIRRNTIVFGIGPAGTGKTYLAVALAVAAYKSGTVDKIILTRPALEAGEKLGFLPGDLQTKVDPYLRPLYDALGEMLGTDNYLKLTERGIIEVAPLAYMRGRTLNRSFIILDEAQNTTKEQMKMFLTRLGEGSKAVVTGDITQIDLPYNVKSGLKDAKDVLRNIDDISFVEFTEKDVIRHELVQKIVLAYERYKRMKNE